MSGHSKWATTHRQKEATDKQRSKIFAKAVREITVAVKNGGGTDPSRNAQLRLAIQNAKGFNMPKDNIDRAINKGTVDTVNYFPIVYEGTWVRGVQLVISCMTDNQNRTVGDIRSVLNKHGGKLEKNGSVMFNFEHKSVFIVDKGFISNVDQFLLDNIDNGIEDIYEDNDGNYNIIASVNNFGNIQMILERCGITITRALLQYFPINLITLDDEDSKKALNLLNVLESLDDVQNVSCNIK